VKRTYSAEMPEWQFAITFGNIGAYANLVLKKTQNGFSYQPFGVSAGVAGDALDALALLGRRAFGQPSWEPLPRNQALVVSRNLGSFAFEHTHHIVGAASFRFGILLQRANCQDRVYA
jgi:hypothetical protein